MNLLTVLESITILSIVKVLIVTLMVVYSIFAFLMMQQIGAMTRAITMRDDFIMRLLGIIHFAFALLVLVVAITLL